LPNVLQFPAEIRKSPQRENYSAPQQMTDLAAKHRPTRTTEKYRRVSRKKAAHDSPWAAEIAASEFIEALSALKQRKC